MIKAISAPRRSLSKQSFLCKPQFRAFKRHFALRIASAHFAGRVTAAALLLDPSPIALATGMIQIHLYAEGWPDSPGDPNGIYIGGKSFSVLLRKGTHPFLTEDWRSSLTQPQRDLLKFDLRPWEYTESTQDTKFAEPKEWEPIFDALTRAICN